MKPLVVLLHGLARGHGSMARLGRHLRAQGFDTGDDASFMGKFAINRQVQQAHVGAIFTPIPGVDLGIEGVWGERKTLAGEKGDLMRLNFLARYYIN